MLEEYKKKRDFNKTKEPPPLAKAGKGELTFVVQKHAARRLHYDLRLELDGVLKSWAVPNGPSLDPTVKRLAVQVEDHPLDYGGFEGNIPDGEYGAGEVIVWDKGTYKAQDEDKKDIKDRQEAENYLRSGLEKGKIAFEFHGSKLKGSWALVKMQHTQKDWLLIKHRDEYAGTQEIKDDAASVITGLKVEDLKKKAPKKTTAALNPGEIKGAKAASMPQKLSPMLATLVQKPFSDPKWLFEPKLDGYRVLAFLKDGQVKLISRRGLDTTEKYPQVKAGLLQQRARELILDGEMVALDESGRPCFQCLQDYANSFLSRATGGQPAKFVLMYYVFDIVYLDGYDLRSVSLQSRKKLLTSLLIPTVQIRPVEYFENEGEALFEAAVEQGLEGVMAKQIDSRYEDGKRSQEWLKIKVTQSDEFVIGGFTQGTGNRAKTFGALLLGSYDKTKKLTYRGSVGTGFDGTLLSVIRNTLKKIEVKNSPFTTMPALPEEVTWVKPELVAEVKYAEITREGYLRAPVFMRLREDKVPDEVKTQDGPIQKVAAREAVILPVNKTVESILHQLADSAENINLEVEGNTLTLTNLSKELWPSGAGRPGITKRQLLEYLARVAPYMLPHLKDRPVTLTRYPHGVQSQHFYQRHSDQARPQFVETAELSEGENEKRDFLLCNNLTTLLWLGQLAVIDLHSWFSRITPGVVPDEGKAASQASADFNSNYPDFIVFDIDPYIYSGEEKKGDEPELNKKAFKMTAQVALWFKEILDGLGLPAFVKTSGMTGLHVYVPLVRRYEYEAIHAASKTIAEHLLQKHPQEVTMEWQVVKRTGKIFLDYNQNVRSKTLASIYSPRHSPLGTVSTPLEWSEVEKVYPTDFTVLNLPQRLAKVGDLWAGILDKPGDLDEMQKSKGKSQK